MIYKREKNRASTWHVQAHRRRVAEPCARPALLPGRPARQSALPDRAPCLPCLHVPLKHQGARPPRPVGGPGHMWLGPRHLKVEARVAQQRFALLWGLGANGEECNFKKQKKAKTAYIIYH